MREHAYSALNVSTITGLHVDIMRTPIQDEFTYLPISRQRKYQLRKKRDKRCTECGAPAIRGVRCLKHLVMAREFQRKKRGLKRRYKTLSYRLQRQA
jgi:hypothetical protein